MFSRLIFLFTLNFNSLLLQLQFSFFPLLNVIIFFTQICNCVTSTLQIFLLWFHFLLLFIPLPFLSSSQVFYSLCFSFPLLFRFQLSYYRFLRCLQLQLRLFIPEPFPTHSNDIHTCLLFVFHLCFKFSLSSMYLSLTERLLTFNRGSLRPFRLFAIFSLILPLEILPFLYLKGSGTKILFTQAVLVSLVQLHA